MAVAANWGRDQERSRDTLKRTHDARITVEHVHQQAFRYFIQSDSPVMRKRDPFRCALVHAGGTGRDFPCQFRHLRPQESGDRRRGNRDIDELFDRLKDSNTVVGLNQ